VDKLIRSRYESAEPKVSYSSVIDEASGLLLTTTSADVHSQIEHLKKELDVEADPNRSNVQFYRLVNTTAAEVLATIRSLETRESSDQQTEGRSAFRGFRPVIPDGLPSGPNYPPSPPGTPPYLTPAFRAYDTATQPSSQDGGLSGAAISAISQNAVVTADQNTNSIIVIAPPDIQKVYRQLITLLDRRRPQVLVEVTLVTIDTSDSFSLGVELSTKQSNGTDILVFSSFGLSEIDTATGIPSITPAPGFNGIMIDTDTLNIVVQALATDSRARVLAAPKVLVNDNATATLNSVVEAPYISVNASETVSTTSFAGYAEAGTTVTVTPHISEGDYVQLDYTVMLSSFSGDPDTTIAPPPRQTNDVTSQVTIPHGYAVIVGGLTRKDSTHSESKIPFLGDIPIIKYLFGTTDITNSQSTLFVFIRPTILRDDKFEDLKYLSESELASAELPPNLPASDPILMR